ncbi:MAG TPA: M13 family metallopeptidase [Gemmatimonadales bacterium]|nr:M13 family metallopeptidase [Gemmatimonadales bacterium]
MHSRLASATLALVLACAFGAPMVLAQSEATSRRPAGPSSRPAVLPALDRANLDTTCAACANFYQFANGGWAARNPIPAAYSRWSGFDELTERNQLVLRDILERAARAAEATRDGDTRRLGRFYATCMDSARAEADGVAPLRADLARIAAIRDRAALRAEIARLHGRGVFAAFTFAPAQDPRNSARVIADASQGGLGLPDRDYYVRADSASRALRDAYVAYAARALELAGAPAARAEADARRILALETALAEASMTRVERRDPEAQVHTMAVADADTLAPGMHWGDYVAAAGLADLARLNVSQPKFFQALGRELETRPLEDWRAYLAFRLLRANAAWLSSPFVAADFRFASALSGAKELQPRWKRCLRMADQNLGDALGRAFVETTFTPEAKAELVGMVDAMREVLRERIGRLEWMSEATRRQALVKLDAFGRKIGYPEKWQDYSALTVERGPFVANLRRVLEFRIRRDRAKIGRPVDRTEWGMTPPTVNAYYDPQLNEIAFPAGRVQPPFFHVSYDLAANYGGIGGTIGHEMTHGFDDEGRKYDAAGNLADWWTAEDARAFEARAAVVERQYSDYVVLDSLHVNGKLTLGENIADLGGMTVAYYALQRALAAHPEQRRTIDGFTPEQRFFLAYAQARRASFRPEQLRLMVQTDPHSPNEFRVNGPLSNMPEFRAAWGCRAGDAMVRPDSVRAQIW